jgi:hypothetical protein
MGRPSARVPGSSNPISEKPEGIEAKVPVAKAPRLRFAVSWNSNTAGKMPMLPVIPAGSTLHLKRSA